MYAGVVVRCEPTNRRVMQLTRAGGFIGAVDCLCCARHLFIHAFKSIWPAGFYVASRMRWPLRVAAGCSKSPTAAAASSSTSVNPGESPFRMGFPHGWIHEGFDHENYCRAVLPGEASAFPAVPDCARRKPSATAKVQASAAAFAAA